MRGLTTLTGLPSSLVASSVNVERLKHANVVVYMRNQTMGDFRPKILKAAPGVPELGAMALTSHRTVSWNTCDVIGYNNIIMMLW